MWRLEHTFMLLYRGLVFALRIFFLLLISKKHRTNAWLWQRRDGNLLDLRDKRMDWLIHILVCLTKCFVWTMPTSKGGRKNPAVSLNHLFKPFKQTWMISFFLFIFYLPLWGAIWSNQMNLLNSLTGVVTFMAELVHPKAVTSSTGTMFAE